jgi:hypothetical protein
MSVIAIHIFFQTLSLSLHILNAAAIYIFQTPLYFLQTLPLSSTFCQSLPLPSAFFQTLLFSSRFFFLYTASPLYLSTNQICLENHRRNEKIVPFGTFNIFYFYFSWSTSAIQNTVYILDLGFNFASLKLFFLSSTVFA